jgi:undecaprenyl diphosphate synthase
MTSSDPKYVAIITDGNGRWAQRRGLSPIEGHRAGADVVKDRLRDAVDLGIDELTVFSFSTENWSRPIDEVDGLMRMFGERIDNETPELHEEGVRMRFIGRREGVDADLIRRMEWAEDLTKDNDVIRFFVAFNYGGRAEIIDAVKQLCAEVRAGRLDPEAIDEALLGSRLYTAGQPDPDLLIRTSGELRISNFLLWQIAYSEIWVTDVLWPDFRRRHLLQAILDFQKRERRYGGIVPA